MNATHRGKENSYYFECKGRKIAFLLTNPLVPQPTPPPATLLAIFEAAFNQSIKEDPFALALVVKESNSFTTPLPPRLQLTH